MQLAQSLFYTSSSKPISTSLAGYPPRIPQFSRGGSLRVIRISLLLTPRVSIWVAISLYSAFLAWNDLPGNTVISMVKKFSDFPSSYSKFSGFAFLHDDSDYGHLFL